MTGLHLDTDASGQAIAAVLSQVQNGEERVVYFASRVLNKFEKNYSIARLELLAVVHFVKYFKHFLLGRKFTLRTDHSALTYLFSCKKPGGQLARWSECLSAYHFTIEHKPGRLHSNVVQISLPKDSKYNWSGDNPETPDRTNTFRLRSTAPVNGNVTWVEILTRDN